MRKRTWIYRQAVQNNGPNYYAIKAGCYWGAPAIAAVYDEEHAKLIAAAPDTAAERDRLLKALKAARPFLNYVQAYGRAKMTATECAACDEAVRLVNAALNDKSEETHDA